MLLTGIGVGLTLPTLMATGTSQLPPHAFATGSAVINMLRQVGLAIGVAVLIAAARYSPLAGTDADRLPARVVGDRRDRAGRRTRGARAAGRQAPARRRHARARNPRRRRGALVMSAVGVEQRAARTKSISWHDPAALAAAGAELSGREFLEAIVDGRLPPPPIASADRRRARLGRRGRGAVPVHARRIDLQPDRDRPRRACSARCSTPPPDAPCTPCCPPAPATARSRSRSAFSSPLHASSGPIEAHGHALRVGGRVAFAEAHARDQNGELVGHATTSLALSPRSSI